MTKSSLRALVCVALAALVAACAAPARVAGPDPALQCRPVAHDRGIGGTGISPDRGIGGTGVLAHDRGIGGTGIVGTVTGFGSICVNGIRVAYDDATPVTANDMPANASALQIGMTVAVIASAQDGDVKAAAIEIIHAVVGPVTAGADAANAFTVMGLPVQAASAAGIAANTLAVGDMVAVAGLQRLDGTIDATRIERVPAGAQSLLRGVAARTPAMSYIGTIAVAGPRGQLPADGVWAVAKGTWARGLFTADTIASGVELRDAAVDRMSVEGYLFARPDGGFAIRGVPVRENAATGLDRNLFGRLANGQRVQLLGTREGDGALRAEILIVPERLHPLSGVLADATTDAAASATRTTDTQTLRGTYGTTTVRTIRPADTRPVVRPNTLERRPAPRPEIPRPPPRRPGG